jgi:ParB family chromosome partitioning protein
MARPALGRGLDVLLGGASPSTKPAPPPSPTAAATAPPAATDARERVERVALSRIRPSNFQPRKDFTEEALRELADSIRAQGIVQPLIVRAAGDHYELIAGERRWRAAQLCGLAEVPVLVREADDAAALELALIENLQRENLNPLEEAQGYQQLLDQFDLRQEDVAAKVGRSRVAVANALRLLRLAPEIQTCVRNGQLSVGHAKVILALDNPAEQTLAAEKIIKDALNVRQTEALVARLQSRATPGAALPASSTKQSATQDVHLAALQTRLQERLGTKVALRYHRGKGAVEIRFFNDADLERVLELLGVSVD